MKERFYALYARSGFGNRYGLPIDWLCFNSRSERDLFVKKHRTDENDWFVIKKCGKGCTKKHNPYIGTLYEYEFTYNDWMNF